MGRTHRGSEGTVPDDSVRHDGHLGVGQEVGKGRKGFALASRSPCDEAVKALLMGEGNDPSQCPRVECAHEEVT